MTTTIKLRDYDLSAARQRFLKRVSRERGLVFDWNDGIDYGRTKLVRELEGFAGLRTAIFHLEISIQMALAHLPVAEGGTVVQVEGGYAARVANLRADLPLVRALMVLRGHPCHRGFDHFPLIRPEQPDGREEGWNEAGSSYDAGPLLESFYRSSSQQWDLAQLERAVFDGARQYYGEVDVEPAWTPNMIYPGSRVSEYMRILAETFLLDAFDAFDPAFTRRDALVGEWWLLQPVSPRLHHHHLAQRFGLHHAGFLPPQHVDAVGRLVMACLPMQAMSDGHRTSLIEDSKFVAGWQKVMWSKDRAPLSDPSFDLVDLEGVTEDSYGPYRHSSELPAWPPA